MKGFWLILVAGSLSATPVAGSFFEQFWANDQDFFDKINDKIEESNKTEPPTSQPTMEPTLTPTVAPTKSPSYRPSSSPTESAAPSVQPSFSPSVQPSIHPTLSSQPSTQPSLSPSISAQPSSQPSMSPTTSAKPSTSPTLSTSPSTQPSTEPTNSIAPSNEPSLSPTTTSFPSSQPSAHPSISTHPTLTTAPSSQPSLRPSTSTMPSSSPSSNPSYTPTTAPSSSPSEEPSVVPSEAPSETKPITTRIIIKSDSTNKNMIAVGAVCLLLMASAVAYVTKNAKRLKGRERNDFHKFPSLQFSSSMSQSSDEPDQQQHDAAKLPVDFVAQSYSTNNRQDDHDDTDMVDIDLEDGRACMRTEDSVAESSIGLNSLPSDVKEKRVSTISKIFKRRPIGAEKQGMSWMDIRDEGSPACSSGCEPAKGENSLSSLSPRFSPFKNISSMRTKMQSLVSISSEDTDDLPSVEGSFNGDHNLECVGLPTIFSENEGVPESFDGNTTTVERQECLDLSSISNGIQERTIHTDTECVGSPSSIFSGLGGESSSEAREVSRQSFEQSMNQLKNILGTIKSLGSYEESLISASSAGASVEDFKNRAKARLGLNQGQVNDHQIASSHSQESLPSHREVNMPRPDITYEKELLSAAGSHCDGFDFNTVFSDPRNEVYQCNVPSGPLGIVVEATKVGLRVQKINSMSPLRNKISVGDIIIAVDEVDVVGVDPGVFWQLVSRRANKQQRCFVVLRI